mmetsp:Transcript_17470/g.31528  ORF Transcript_17470/g.31528 Transcript_17470/m.31528 type:complete len:747 (-) Transcript_17470:13-2253(-)
MASFEPTAAVAPAVGQGKGGGRGRGARGKGGKSVSEGNADPGKLDSLLKKDLDKSAGKFWELLKTSVLTVYGSTEAAFKAHAHCKDGVYGRLSFPKFQLLCESVGIQLETQLLRSLFDLPLAVGGQRWNLRDFQDTLQISTVDRVKGKLTEHMQSQSHIKSHIDTLIRVLALESGEQNQRRAVARFQQKLTLSFCMDLRAALKEWSYTSRSNEITSAEFIALARERTRFLEYEEDFLANFFDRIDRTREGHVSIHDLVVSLILVGTEVTAFEKLWLLFTIFDLDADGCLTPEEILHMFCSITIHAAISSGDQHTFEADMLLGDELSLSKARRLFEVTMLHLSQQGVEELCTFQELCSVMQAHTFLLKELIPGTFRVVWVLQPVSGPKSKQSETKRAPAESKKGKDAKGAQMSAAPSQATTAAGAHGSPGGPRSHRHTTVQEKPARGTVAGGHHQVAFSGSHSSPALHKKADREESFDRFRIHAALRFRHAVRGEWELVEALRASDHPETQDSDRLLLEQMGHGHVGSSSSHDVDIQKASREPIVVPVHLHQRSNAWRDEHQKTLSSWSKMELGLSDVEAERQKHIQRLASQGASLAPRHSESGGSTGSSGVSKHSRSMPSLRQEAPRAKPAKSGPQLVPQQHGGNDAQAVQRPKPSSPSMGGSAQELRTAASAKLAEMVQETQDVLEDTPLKDERFGKQSVWRLKALAQIDDHHKHKHKANRISEKIEYECHLCRGHHSIAVASVA